MASGTIKKMGEIKSYSAETTTVNINSGSSGELPLTVPSDCNEIIAAIPLSIKVGSTYGTAVPAIVSGVTITGNTASIYLRSFATQGYRVQYVILYR
jgi:hypothetical protein